MEQLASSTKKNKAISKFGDLNVHFRSSRTSMTLRAKFEGRQCILLLHDLSGAILLVVGGVSMLTLST